MKPVRALTESRARRVYRVALTAVIATVVASAIAVAVPLIATSSPDFFARYHLLERKYVNLESSAHEGIGCRACHETQALANGLQLVADYYTSLVSSSEEPRFFTFEPPRNEACLACHEEDWSTETSRTARIPHPAHQRVASETRECVSCHKWTAHRETYLEKHEQMPFSRTCVAYGCHVGTKTSEQCYSCHHVLHDSAEQWKTEHPQVVKANGQNGCLEGCHTVVQCQQCHTTGERPEFDGLPIEVSMQSIETLHVEDGWTESTHGPEALKGPDRCMRCHQSEGECDECHLERPDSHGPTKSWIGRHSDTAAAVDDPRCLACHEKPWCEDCHRQFEEME